jgi:hypothetical protein
LTCRNAVILIKAIIFSRFTWVKPLKSKHGDEVTDVFTESLKRINQEIFNLMMEKNYIINILKNY